MMTSLHPVHFHLYSPWLLPFALALYQKAAYEELVNLFGLADKQGLRECWRGTYGFVNGYGKKC
jgi:hypothetical protein